MNIIDQFIIVWYYLYKSFENDANKTKQNSRKLSKLIN